MRGLCKVLIVDDNPTNIAILTEILEDYELDSASSGDDALKIVKEYHPDLILLDIMMPGMNGYDVCRKLREDPDFSRTKIIMVSAKAMVSERLKGYEMGADDYITKPFEEDELLAKVRVYSRLTSIEEVDQLKTEMLRLLCLDTVNPLSSIVAPLSQLMKMETFDIDDCKAKVATSYENAVSLQRLFEKVVLWSSIKSGKLDFRFVDADFRSIVQSAIQKVEGQARDRNITIRQVLPEVASTRLDTSQVTRVVNTLLDNAIRFSPDDGRVIVEISEVDNALYLSIIDEGKGIDHNFLPKVFREFTYMEINKNSAAWRGLSLSIAQLVMQAHQGKIEIDSSQGSGTIVTVILPRNENATASLSESELDRCRPKTSIR